MNDYKLVPMEPTAEMAMSDRKEVADYLRRYNAWRRGEDERAMDEAGIVPAELGQMLDSAVELLEARADKPTKEGEA